MTAMFPKQRDQSGYICPGQIISCVTKASACHRTLHPNHWHRLWEILAIIDVKSIIVTFKYVCRFIANMLDCGGILLTDLNSPILKVWSSAPQAKCATMWRSNSLLASLYNPIVNPAMVSTVKFYERNELYGSPDVRNCRMPDFIGWAFLW